MINVTYVKEKVSLSSHDLLPQKIYNVIGSGLGDYAFLTASEDFIILISKNWVEAASPDWCAEHDITFTECDNSIEISVE